LLLAFGICQALAVLWIPLKPQSGREITRKEVPKLFQLLDTLRKDLVAKRFDHVRMTPDMNAAVQMLPRLGVFGFNRSDLYLGLPLMRALTPAQFSAVVAHEFAHSSSRHDRFGMWIYRLRQSWMRIFAELQNNPSSGFVQRLRGITIWFVGWYWPRFNAFAFVLSRADEYEADRMAAERVGYEPAAEALFRIVCLGNRLDDRFWTDLTQLAKINDNVPDDLTDRMQSFLETVPEAADATRWLEQSAKTLTGNVDTHPSLSDRLQALGSNVNQFVNAPFPQIPSSSAADVFLDQAIPMIARDVNLLWQKDNALRWHNVFHQARRAEKHLESVVKTTVQVATVDQMEAPVVSSKVDLDQMWKQAVALSSLHGTTAAESLLRELLTHQPFHSLANVTLGRDLLERGYVEGEQFLRRILEDDGNELTPAACDGLINYFQQRGLADRVHEIRSLLSRFETSQAAAVKERSSVSAKDRFVTHGLSDLELKAALDHLAKDSELVFAWLVRKEMKHFANQRLYVLVVQSRRSGWLGGSDPSRDMALVSRSITQIKLPGRVLIICPQGGFRSLARKIIAHADARIDLIE
jgi:Zn-dependent protease with chaperone function